MLVNISSSTRWNQEYFAVNVNYHPVSKVAIRFITTIWFIFDFDNASISWIFTINTSHLEISLMFTFKKKSANFAKWLRIKTIQLALLRRLSYIDKRSGPVFILNSKLTTTFSSHKKNNFAREMIVVNVEIFFSFNKSNQ